MFKGDHKRELKENLEKYLSRFPEESPEFLEVVSKALKEFKKRVEQKRASQAANAMLATLSFVMDSKKFKKLEEDVIPLVIDTVFYLFPKGKVDGHAEVEKKLFEYFKELCKKVDILNNPEWAQWLQNTKGQEYFEWVKIALREEFTKEEQEAIRRFEAGEQYSVSSFIDEDSIIAGYGELNYDFEFPLPVSYIRKIFGTTSWREYLDKKEKTQ